jgi:DNA gyrase, B subunit
LTGKLKIALSVVSVIYPFALFFAGDFAFWVVWALAVLWIARGAFSSGFERRLSVLAAGFFIVCMIFRGGFLAYLYPVLVSLAFLAFFAFSLKNEAVITKIARLKEPDLDEKGVNYTRNLTKIWCAFFVFNAALSLALALIEDKLYWSVYSGAVSYALMGALFFGEILFRKRFIKSDEL